MPFLTIYTPTYRRPQSLIRCLASVQAQTAVRDIEHIVIPDHIGVGVGGMYARVPTYASAMHGQYVMFICDDDKLASPTVVEELRAFAIAKQQPPLIIVQTSKNGKIYPDGPSWPPRCGYIDLNCLIARQDVWQAHAHAYATARYESDYDFAHAIYLSGVTPIDLHLLFSTGDVSRGRTE